MPAIHGSVSNEEYLDLHNLSRKEGREPSDLVSRYVKEGIARDVKKL